MISPVPDASLIAAPRRWDFLMTLMLEQGYKNFVEVGCKEGRTTGHILKNVPESQVVAIDPWIVQPKSDDPKRETYESWDFAKIEREFWENVGAEKHRCTMQRKTSEEAAKQFPYLAPFGRSIASERGEALGADLVFIDALHDHESVAQDIDRWWPLVRSGGILSGHDWNHKWPGVERAVAEKFNLLSVGVGPDSVWFVLKPGRTE